MVGEKSPKEISPKNFPGIKSLNFPIISSTMVKISSPRHIIVHHTGDKEKIISVSREKKRKYALCKGSRIRMASGFSAI